MTICRAGVSFSGTSDDDDRRSEPQPVKSPGPPPWGERQDIPLRTLHEIQVENMRLQEENDRLKWHCLSAEKKRKEVDVHQRAEEIKRVRTESVVGA